MKKNSIETPATQTNDTIANDSEVAVTPPFSVIEDEAGQLFIEGTPSQTKESVFSFLEKNVLSISREEYEKRFGHSGIAHVAGVVGTTEKGKAIVNVKIYLNREAFTPNGDDYTDLIPAVVRHEVVEFWLSAKTGYSFVSRPESIAEEKVIALSHGLALRKEYEYAFETEKADRLLKFIIRHINNDPACSQQEKATQIKENVNAYNLEKRRHKKRLGKQKENEPSPNTV